MSGENALWEMLSRALREATSVEERVFYLRAPTNAQLPYIVLTFPYIEVVYDTPRQDWEARCVVECYSQQASRVRDLAAQVRHALHQSQLGYSNWRTVFCIHDSTRMEYQELTGAPLVYCNKLSFLVRITEEK